MLPQVEKVIGGGMNCTMRLPRNWVMRLKILQEWIV